MLLKGPRTEGEGIPRRCGGKSEGSLSTTKGKEIDWKKISWWIA